MGSAGMRLCGATVWAARGVLSLVVGMVGFAACGGSSSSASPPGAAIGGAAGQDTGGAADVPIGRTDGGTAGHAMVSGTAGVAGDAAAGAGGVAVQGPDPTHSGPPLGRACSSDDDCEDLKCVLSTETVLHNQGAPPKGVCTLPCQLPTVVDPDDPCQDIDPAALCFPVDDVSTTGYCIEGCSFGPREPGQAKCHERAEFACQVALVQPTNYPCLDAVDCQAGEYCGSDGYCQIVMPGCLPSCRGDLDCAAGLHCDQSWGGGACVEAAPTGKALGEACAVVPLDQPAEPDECLGYCQQDTRGSSDGHCGSLCTYGEGCSWDTATARFDGACILISQAIEGPSATPGDFGYCNQTCNCSDDCRVIGQRCVQLGNRLGAEFSGPGLCLTPVQGDKFIEACKP